MYGLVHWDHVEQSHTKKKQNLIDEDTLKVPRRWGSEGNESLGRRLISEVDKRRK